MTSGDDFNSRTYTADVDTRAERYALAGALAVTTADLLRALHRAAGVPGEVASLSPQRRLLAIAAAKSRGAAGACSALVARLLIVERDEARRDVPDIGSPEYIEPGVTTVEGLAAYAEQVSRRAAIAARADVAAAAEQWQGWDGAAALEIEQLLLRALGYVDRIVVVAGGVNAETDGFTAESARDALG